MKWLWMVLLAGCSAPEPKVPPGSPLGPPELMKCDKLAQFLICNPMIEMARQ